MEGLRELIEPPLENDALCACAGFDAGVVVDGKLSPLKASTSPPNESFRCLGAGGGEDVRLEKEPNAADCAGGGEEAVGLGEAYSERIDCLRSGREGPEDVEPGVAVAERLPEGGGPKKSSPNNESPVFCGFTWAGDGVGAGAGAGWGVGIAGVVVGGVGETGGSSSTRLPCTWVGRG